MVWLGQQWLVDNVKADSSSHLVDKAGCLSRPSLVLESWESQGELLVFTLHWNAEDLDLILAAETE